MKEYVVTLRDDVVEVIEACDFQNAVREASIFWGDTVVSIKEAKWVEPPLMTEELTEREIRILIKSLGTCRNIIALLTDSAESEEIFTKMAQMDGLQQKLEQAAFIKLKRK